MSCKICGSATYSLGKSKVLTKYWVEYTRCRNCHFVAAENVNWLDEAYSEAINATDLGLVGRNISLSYSFNLLIQGLFNPNGKFMDYGGGYGLLVRIMRDRGFDFYRYDQYCSNLFAKGFDVTGLTPKGEYEIVFAIEVFEHLLNPVEEIKSMLQFSRNICFATETLPDDKVVLPGEWLYYGLEHGQHISLFTKKSLQILAEKLGCHFITNGKGLHLFSDKPISDLKFRFFSSSILGKYLSFMLKRKSLQDEDYRKVISHE